MSWRIKQCFKGVVILYDFAKYCQCPLRELLLISILILGSCTSKKNKEAKSEVKPELAGKYTPVKVQPFWLKGPDFLVPKSDDLEDEFHAFFDAVPFSDPKTNELNVILTMLKDSNFYYQLDTQSGKVFRSKDLCPQEDVWDKYGGTIYRPPFTEAIVPRLLDQLGYPQKVIIFGESRYFPEKEKFGENSYRVRVVGGFLEQYCRYFPCGSTREWMSRLVLVAVNPRDPKFGNIKTMDHLKEKVDWSYVQAFMENYQGRSLRASIEQPAYRALGEVDASDAFNFAFSKGYFFKLPQLKTLKKNCWSIYDFTWKGLEKVRVNQSKKVKDLVKERNKRVQDQLVALFETNVIGDEEIDLSIDELVTIDFSVFFRYWYKKFGLAFNYCYRFVPAANHRVAPERHWTLDYFALFMKMEELGYIFKCSKKAWVENPILRDGSYTVNPVEEKDNCTTGEFDRAFISLEQFVNAKAIDHNHFVRYVEYDTGAGGSHQRIFSWIEETGKRMKCKEKYSRKDQPPAFPPNVTWKRFGENTDESILIRTFDKNPGENQNKNQNKDENSSDSDQ